MDQDDTQNLPFYGYVATPPWAEKHTQTAAAFVRAIEEGQTIGASEPPVVRVAIAKADDLPSLVTVVMALPGFPTGPVNAQNIQRVAEVMREFGVLGKQYSAEVEDGTLIRAMVS